VSLRPLSQCLLHLAFFVLSPGSNISCSYFNDKSQQKSVDSDRATDTDQTTVRTEDHLALPPPSSPPTIDKTTTRKLSLQEMAQESSAAKLCLCKVDMTFPPVEHSDYVSPQSPPCPTKAASELPDTIRTLKRKSEAVEELQESPESVSARVHGNIMTPSSRTSQKERSIGYEGDTEDRKKKQCKHSETAPSASSDSLEFAPGFMRTAINTFTPINAIHAASQPPQGLNIATATQEADLENPAPKQQSKKSAKQAKPTPSQPAPTGAPTHAAPTAPAKPAPSAPALLPKPPPAAPPAAAAGAPAGPKKRRRVEVRALTAAETAAALRVRPADLEAMKRPDVETLARQLGVYWPGATKAGQIDRIVQWQVSCAAGAAAGEAAVWMAD